VSDSYEYWEHNVVALIGGESSTHAREMTTGWCRREYAVEVAATLEELGITYHVDSRRRHTTSDLEEVPHDG